MSRKKQSTAQAEHRIKYSESLIWGIHPVVEVLRTEPERVVELFLQKDKHGTSWEELIELARQVGVKLRFVEKLRITENPGERINHQGAVVRMAPTPLFAFDELVKAFRDDVERGTCPRVIACDSIQDPHNLGAIIRSAHAAGVDYFVTTRERSAPLGGTAAKASAGAISRVKISQVTNLTEALHELKEAGAWVFGAVKDVSAESIYQADFNVPVCLVVGNEGSGIRPLVRKTCDILISIPMAGKIDSLNSSVAAAVILFEMHRQSIAAGTSAAE